MTNYPQGGWLSTEWAGCYDSNSVPNKPLYAFTTQVWQNTAKFWMSLDSEYSDLNCAVEWEESMIDNKKRHMRNKSFLENISQTAKTHQVMMSKCISKMVHM